MANLANKYRPKTFEDVTEQSTVVNILSSICKSDNLTSRNFLLIGPAGTGKAQPLYSKVLTTHGYKAMGAIREGDKVYTHTGAVAEVDGIYPQGERDIYQITLDDGAVFEVSDNHNNVVHRYITEPTEVITTTKLIDEMNEVDTFYIPGTKLYFDPPKSSVGYTLRSDDFAAELYEAFYQSPITSPSSLYERVISDMCDRLILCSSDYMVAVFSYLGQLVAKHNNTDVWARYKLKGRYLRPLHTAAMACGIGSIFSEGVDGIQKLHIFPTLRTQYRRITNITYIGKQECQCIHVNHPDHTYITDGAVITHNTTTARIMDNVLNNGTGDPIELDAASSGGIDSVREIINQARSYPVGSKYKVFILDEVHAFSNNAWQALLKTLEESPARSIFVLCVDGEGLINTDKGVKKISNAVVGDMVWDGSQYRKIVNVFDKGKSSECIQITFQSGNVLRCTPDHKFKILSNDQEVWKRACDISIGDVSLRYKNIDRSMWGREDISEDEAFFLGYITGNGNYDNHSMHLYTPYHKWDRLEVVLDSLVTSEVINDYIKDTQPNIKDKLHVTRIHFTKGGMNTWYNKVGADPTYTRGTKSIPKSVFQFNDAQFKAFVDGWYFADGCGRFDSFFEYKYGTGGSSPFLYCSNINMITQLSQLLTSHGYFPSLRTYKSIGEKTPGRTSPNKKVTSYTLYLYQKPGYFYHSEFRDILISKYRCMPAGRSKLALHDICNKGYRISPKMLLESGYTHYVNDGYFDTIVSIDRCPSCHVYDIEVEDSHQFIYNGVCTHNCTTNPEKIPATILSRVQTFQLSKISLDGITNRLKYVLDNEIKEGRDIKYDMNAVRYIAKLANGGMRDALTLLDKLLAYSNTVNDESVKTALNLPSYDDFFRLLSAYGKSDNTTIAMIINDVYNSGVNFTKWFDEFHSFVMNVLKYIFVHDINLTMVPSYYEDKISQYTVKHAVVCMRLGTLLLEMNSKLKLTQYLQETALTYLCTPKKIMEANK